jgi:hypothetical protein
MGEKISELIGKTLTEIKVTKDQQGKDDEIIFICDDGDQYLMYHYQECCESVWIEDITGDLQDLIGYPCLMAEESEEDGTGDGYGTSTWTFYKFGTIKGYVTIRWIGESNGCYSESVDFEKIDKIS